MDARGFFREVARANYGEFQKSPEDFRSFWNAVVSMNTVAEWIALHRLGYRQVSEEELRLEANRIRSDNILEQLNDCAIPLKHVRRSRQQRQTASSGLTPTSTGFSSGDKSTWVLYFGERRVDVAGVLDSAITALLEFPELAEANR